VVYPDNEHTLARPTYPAVGAGSVETSRSGGENPSVPGGVDPNGAATATRPGEWGGPNDPVGTHPVIIPAGFSHRNATNARVPLTFLPVQRLGVMAVVLAVLLGGLAGPAASEGTPGLADARSRANDLAKRVHQLEAAIGELDGEIRELEDERTAAEAELQRLRGKIRELAIEQYMEAEPDVLTMPGSDLNEQGQALALAEIVGQSDRDSVDRYRATRAALERATRDLDGKQADQQEQLDRIKDERRKLDAELARLEALEAERVEAERRAAEERARRERDEAAEAARKQADQLKAQQQAAAAGKAAAQSGGSPGPPPPPPPRASGPPPPPPGPIASGEWVCPVQGARTFRDSWGEPRSGGRSHRGVDIMSPRGTPVVTPVAGTVTLKGDRLGGLSFHLQGEDGKYYYGTHLDSYAGPSGRLPAGTVVGYVGDTGNAVGTHLHFEIHPGGYGNAINPYPTVAKYC
jgi:peptidoglycan LD-endopeptidase LytH